MDAKDVIAVVAVASLASAAIGYMNGRLHEIAKREEESESRGTPESESR